MERNKLYDALPLPNQSIDFYENILETGRHEKVVDRYGGLYIYHGLIFVLLTAFVTFSYLFIEAYELLRFDFVAKYVTIPIIFCGFLIFFMSIIGGLHPMYYRYYTISPLYEFSVSDDLLLATMMYKQYKNYFINDGDVKVFNTRNIFREEHSKTKRFLHMTTEDKDKFLRENTTHFLHENAKYHSTDYTGLNREFIDTSLIERIQDDYISDMCKRLNDSFINGRDKEAMFLARHILEVYIKHIFENDPEFRIEYHQKYKSNGGTTLGGLVDKLAERTEESYQIYLNGHFNTVNEFKSDIRSVNQDLNSFIHGDVSYEEIFEEQEFKQDYEKILTILIVIRENVEVDMTVVDRQNNNSGENNSENEDSDESESGNEDYSSASFEAMDAL